MAALTDSPIGRRILVGNASTTWPAAMAGGAFSGALDEHYALASALYESFGRDFDIWFQADCGWHLLNQGKARAARPALSFGDYGEAAELIAPKGPGSSWRLVIPATINRFENVWAVAVVDEKERQLALRAARTFQQFWRQRQDLLQRNQEVKSFIGQITDDLEELTFLRQLTDHLELAEVSEDPWQVAKAILPLLRQLVKAETLLLVATAYDADHQTICPGDIVLRAGFDGVDEDVCRRLVSEFCEAAEEQPVVKNHFQERFGGERFPGVESLILHPIAKGDFRIGWLLALNRRITLFDPQGAAHATDSEREFGTVEASLLGASATMLATHARNVQLFREKEALLVSVVRALVSALDAKDRYTCGHSERVAMIARRIGKQLNLGEAACERLYLTGLLHDIGKIGVSDAVLQKPGALEPQEIAQLRQHPDDAWAILCDLEQLRYVLPGVLHHHESYDGKGYPDGLKGEAIPQDARILAVADSYDAMTSDRPYRKGMPEERVDEILRSGSGIQWDPAVIEAFFQAKAEIQEICRGYQPHQRRSRVTPKRATDGGK
jgi:HD-GYP domain-containing protein (c-di-GMP phosphodiesterase class II)